MLGARPWPVFCLLLGVSSDYAQPITGQVTEVTCPLLRRSQTELTPIQRQKTDPGQVVTPGLYLVFNIKRWTLFRARAPGVYIPSSILIVIDSPQTNLRHDFSKLLPHTLTYGSRFLSLPALAGHGNSKRMKAIFLSNNSNFANALNCTWRISTPGCTSLYFLHLWLSLSSNWLDGSLHY